MNYLVLLSFFAVTLLSGQPPAEPARALLASALAAEKAGKTQSAIRQFHALLQQSPSKELAGQARLEPGSNSSGPG